MIGDLGGDGYTGMTGVRSESHHLDESGTSENTIRSQVVSQNGSVSISAKDDLTARGADIAAGRDVTLIGKNVVLDAGTDDSARNQVDKSSQYGVTLALSGYSVTAAKAVEAAARAVEDGKDSRVAALYGAQAGLALVNGGVIGKDVLTSAGQQTPEVIKVTVSVGGGSQQSESHNTASNQQGTSVKAGNAVTVVATGSGQKDADGFATDGDITGRGVQISGKTVDLVAARDVTLESAQDRASNDSRSSGNNFGIGVGFALGGAQNGFTLELSAAQNKAKANGDSVANENSHISATDRLTVTSGRDTTLKGAQLVADRIEGSVGRDLNIESRQDTDNYHARESSSGMQASICVPPFCYGTTVNASGTMSSGKTDSTYASVREQSGIYAGQGGFDVNVKGNTDLKGGILASTADASKNSLTTGTLTTSDIENKAEYSSGSSQYAASFSAGKSVPDGKDLAGNAVKQGAYMAGNLNLAGNLANTAMASAAGNAQKPITGNASGTTKSAIAAGTVTIMDADGQRAQAGKTVEETLASLNRDTENANQSIDKIFDAQKVKDEQALRQLTGQTIQQAAPIIYNQVGNALKGQDEYVKVAVHGLVGGLVSKALGGDFGTGAVGVAAATAAIAALDENLGSLGVDSATKDKLLQLVGTAVAGAIGGGAAAGTAGMADAYNRQMHPEEAKYIKANADRYAAIRGISREQAEAELTRQVLRQADDVWASRYEENPTARSFLASQTGKQGDGFVYFDGKADGSFDNNVRLGGVVALDPTVRTLYDQAWKTSSAGRNSKIAGSALALGDALKDYAHYASNPKDLIAAAETLATQRELALQNRDLSTVSYLDDKLSMLRMVAQGGQYDAGTMTNDDRIAFGFAADGAGGAIGKTASRISTAISVLKAEGAAKQIADAAIKGSRIDNAIYRDGDTVPDWTSGKPRDIAINAAVHWEKHKSDFPNLKSLNEYIAATKDFVTNPKPGTEIFVRKDGDTLYYNQYENIFAIRNADGLPRTMFKPNSGQDYWINQIGDKKK